MTYSDSHIISSVNTSELSVKSEDKKCAPNQTFQDGSCISLDLMIELAKAYNQDNPKKSIKFHSKLEMLNPNKYKKYLVKEFKTRLNDVCDDQKCWMKQKYVKFLNDKAKQKLKKGVFRPEGPGGKFTWLNTNNINNVMKQYEDKYNDFYFLGTYPVDFDDLNTEIANVDFSNLEKQGKKKFGVVYNLDEHYKSGSHWVASYTDLDKGNVYFFDSYGEAPDPRIRKFLRRVEKYLSSKGVKNQEYKFNKKRHQFKNSECGVYSINFLARLLNGETFEQINGQRITDSEVNNCRKVYFSKL